MRRGGDRGASAGPDGLAVLGRALGAATDERRGIEVVRRHVERACGADAVLLVACGPERGRAELRFTGDAPPPTGMTAAPGSSCLTARLGRPHARRRGEEPLLGCELCGSLTVDTACAPLTAAGAVVGAVLATGRDLAPDAAERLDDIAAVAGPAIAALRSFDLAGAHAHTDALTGLPNRRALEDAAERMIALARRSAQPLAVMRVDLDAIAALNERLGTETGDGVLQALATVLRARLRASDLVSRFGGDEFVVLLPDTGPDVAVELAEGLCRLVHELTPADADLPVTVSVGIAAFPIDGETPGDVLAAATRALNAAKSAGGNRVSALEPPDPWTLLSD